MNYFQAHAHESLWPESRMPIAKYRDLLFTRDSGAADRATRGGEFQAARDERASQPRHLGHPDRRGR